MPLTTDQIITDVEQREGGATVTNDPADHGGRTQYGIDERSHPDAWADGKVTEEEARMIYLTKYVNGPHFDRILDDALRAQLVDYGVTSGPMIAIMKLQEILNLNVDGNLGPITQAEANKMAPFGLNNQLVIKRVKMIGKIVVKDPTQIKFLNGWLDRALQFLT